MDNIKRLLANKPWLSNPEEFHDEMEAIDYEVGKLFAKIERLNGELNKMTLGKEVIDGMWRIEHDQRIRLEERLKLAEAMRDYWKAEAEQLINDNYK